MRGQLPRGRLAGMLGSHKGTQRDEESATRNRCGGPVAQASWREPGVQAASLQAAAGFSACPEGGAAHAGLVWSCICEPRLWAAAAFWQPGTLTLSACACPWCWQLCSESDPAAQLSSTWMWAGITVMHAGLSAA